MLTLILRMHWPVAMSHTRTILSVAHENSYRNPYRTCIFEVRACDCCGTTDTSALLSKRPLFAAKGGIRYRTTGGRAGKRRPLERVDIHHLGPVQLGLDVVGRRVARAASSDLDDVGLLHGMGWDDTVVNHGLAAAAVGLSSGIQNDGSCFDRPSDIKYNIHLLHWFRVQTALGLALLELARLTWVSMA
ncbi:hypothetical protein PRIPAC_74897 [Pristionchus pacificus]|uniref:Uncharacterized protein n=1 Tax=Pristionchus pacificus TaxID=54126 RepID=A0A2A6C6G4_PRIPA|nr:hypothetical protein PRIPAC_74897 [Pristionchus pacificus]|eukprot:PDM73802.1 hypothetical protein PRIPAC_41158 [Pristionchus pacificus]